MNRKQNNLQSKNVRLNQLILLTCVLILCLISFIVGTRFIHLKKAAEPAPSHSASSTSVTRATSSTEETSTTVSSVSSSSSSIPAASTEEPASYAVTFPNGAVLVGESAQYKFSVTTYTHSDEIVVAYKPKGMTAPGAHMGQVASFIPTTVPTTAIQVSENNVVKEVKAATELKLSAEDSSQANLSFFDNFNGNDTKIYAYTNNSGNTVLAFTPAGHQGPYMAVSFQEKQF